MKFLVAVVSVAVVFVSGCNIDQLSLGGDSFAMGNGVQVNSFAFKPARLVSGQSTMLTLDMQNMGGLSVDKVHVNLYGLSNEWYTDSKMIGDVSSSDPRAFDVVGMRAADAELKTPGQKRSIVWKLKSPEEPLEGIEFNHRAYARVCYPYKTAVSAKVEIVGEDEWLVMEQKGSFSQHPISVKQTASPIQISIESMQPIIADGGLRMEMRIANVGGGSAFSAARDCSSMFDGAGKVGDNMLDLNTVAISISGIPGCEVSGADGSGSISLTRGAERSVVVKCSSGMFSSSMPRKELSLDIEFSYNYYIDAEAGVVLVGVEGEEEVVSPVPSSSQPTPLPVPPASDTPVT